MTIAIVCGYDLRSDLGAYVRQVAARLDGIALEAIVLAGGRTSPGIDTSEAREMSRHLALSRPAGVVLLEDESMTTLDNLVFARDLAERSMGKVDRFVVCCDTAHALKALVLARLVLRRPVHVVAVPREVPVPIRLVEPASIVLESAGAMFPPLRRLLSRGAARLKGLGPKDRRPARADGSLAPTPSDV